jgi:histidine ammonia-lyase
VELLRNAGVGGPGIDRFLAPEIETAYQLVVDRSVTGAVASVIGELA